MEKEESQQEVWNEIAEGWDSYRQKPVPELAAILKECAESWQKGKVLEIGCGNCRNLLLFSYNNFECYGIDFSRKMLEMSGNYCKKHDVDVKLKYGLATEIPFPDRSFDYVLSIAMLHHLNAEERVKALQEIKRLMKSNGRAIITVWNKLQPRFFFSKKDISIPWHSRKKTYQRYYHLFSSFELSRLIKKAGFKILKKNTFGRNLVFVVSR
ncbi:MAG: class I SAM-dependent methyltransferase [archaeon]